MLQMKNTGMSLKSILKSATISNAEAFGIDNEYGTIEKGKTANLIILNKNPYLDIEAYNSIITIIKSGKAISRKNLLANKKSPSF